MSLHQYESFAKFSFIRFAISGRSFTWESAHLIPHSSSPFFKAVCSDGDIPSLNLSLALSSQSLPQRCNRSWKKKCCFVWFGDLHPINNLSEIKERVFLGWTSSKLGLMFLPKDKTHRRRWGSNPRPFGLQSSTLPLSHCAPPPPPPPPPKKLYLTFFKINVFKKIFKAPKL